MRIVRPKTRDLHATTPRAALRAALASLAALLAAVAGCAPRVLLERPPEWPAAWANRQLYHTPHAFIYASSPPAAGEADRWAESIGLEFARDTGASASKGLILVTDSADAAPLADPEEFFAVLARAATARVMRAGDSATARSLAGDRPAPPTETDDRSARPAGEATPGGDPTTTPNGAETSREDESVVSIDFSIPADAAEPSAATQPGEVDGAAEARRQLDELGLPPAWLQACTAFPVAAEDVTRTLGLPDEAARSAAWTVAFPTRSACRRGARRLIDATLDRAGLGIAERILVAPWLPLIESLAADELIAARDTAIYEQLVLAVREWPTDVKRGYIEAYAERQQAATERRMLQREQDVRVQSGYPATLPADADAAPAPTTAPAAPTDPAPE